MLEKCCNHSKQCRNNVEMICCVENRRYKSSRVTSTLYCASMIRNQRFHLNVNSSHISTNINAMAELFRFTNKRDLQLVNLSTKKWWMTARQRKCKQPANDFVMTLRSSNSTSEYFDPMKKAQLKALRKVRNKDLVLPLGIMVFGMDCDLVLGWHLTSRKVWS